MHYLDIFKGFGKKKRESIKISDFVPTKLDNGKTLWTIDIGNMNSDQMSETMKWFKKYKPFTTNKGQIRIYHEK